MKKKNFLIAAILFIADGSVDFVVGWSRNESSACKGYLSLTGAHG